MPLHRLVNGHIDELADVNVLSELAAAGSLRAIRHPSPRTTTCGTRPGAQLIKALIDCGHVKRILLATDRIRPHELYPDLGGCGYTYVLDTFLDMLKGEGVTDSEIERICCVNPGEMLAF